MNNYLLVGLVTVLLIFIVLIVSFLKSSKIKLYQTIMVVFVMIVLSFCVTSSIEVSNYIKTLQSENTTLINNDLKTLHYDHIKFEDAAINEFFLTYNQYFGSTTTSGISITNNAPFEAIEFLHDNGISYTFTNFSYSELDSIYATLYYSEFFQDFKVMSLDYQTSTIEITVDIGYEVPDELQYYVNLNIVVFLENDMQNVLT